VSRDDYTGEPFKSRGVLPEVAEERGYFRYTKGDAEPIFQADPRLETGTYQKWVNAEKGVWEQIDKAFAGWVEHYAALSPGWAMRKHALPGSQMDAPLAQLRPDDPVRDVPYGHDHDGMEHVAEDCPCGVHRHGKDWLAGWPEFGVEPPMGNLAREQHEDGKQHRTPDGTLHTPLDGPHKHVPERKYLLMPGPHGKRWDTHPRCTGDRFLAAERVFLHLEGTLKCDSLVSAGEVALDVPSVTMWNRGEDQGSIVDHPDVDGFWEVYRPIAQAYDLLTFIEAYVRAPVIVVCDSDWHHNPEVATNAFCLRDWVRDRGLECAVAAPPEGRVLYRNSIGHEVRKKVGSDDFLARENGHTTGGPDDLDVVELEDPTDLRSFERRYRREFGHGGASGRARPARSVEIDLEILHWYATHSTATGHVKRPAPTIAARLGVSDDAVYDATQRLAGAGALVIEGEYAPLVDTRYVRTRRGTTRNLGRGHEGKTATIALADALRPRQRKLKVGDWLASL